MSFQFRNVLLREVKSYANHTPHCKETTLDCSLGVNPYGTPNAAKKAISAFNPELLQSYPHSDVLTNAIVKYWEKVAPVKPKELTMVNGSICGLYVLNNVFSQTKCNKAVGFIPTFTDMIENLRNFGMEYVGVSGRLDEACSFVTEDLLKEIDNKTALVYIDRPNNPTGQVMTLKDIEKVLAKAKDVGCYVIVDEAYGDFVPREESAMTLRNGHPELIIIKSFSKGFGLANFRCGYIVTSEELADCMSRTINPYILSDLSRDVCAAALTDENHPIAHASEFTKVKEDIKDACGDKISVLKTDGRVPICTLRLNREGDLQALLLEQDVLTVSGVEFEPLDERYVRLRVPTLEYAKKLTDAIKAVAKY